MRAFAEMLRLLLTARVALVHAHVAMRGSFWRKSVFLVLAWLFRRPTVVHLHGSQFETFYDLECGTVRQWLVRRVLERARTVIVLSERWRKYVTAIAPRATVVVVHNFADRGRTGSELTAPAPRRSSNVILFLGELGRRKGTYDLVRAMPHVLRMVPSASLVLAGQGEMEDVARCVRENGVQDQVRLPGWVSGELKSRLLHEAAIFALPSYNENLPVSIIEAMDQALPIVSTTVGGIPDLVRHGLDGYLVPPGSVDELATRIVELLRNDDLRARMGENGRRRVSSTFSPELAVASIAAVYRQCGLQPAGGARTS
jgi:glycosyltransferase involved in cell wall biosynthesis